MKSLRRTILDILLILTYIILSGLYLGAFRGFPKGLDAYLHLGMTKFILKYWPNISWYPNWYGGTPFYLWYAPLPHYLNALVTKLFGWSTEVSLIFLSAISLSLMVIGVYYIVYGITKDHDASLIVSLIVSSSPVWGFLVGGGAYARVIAAAFLPLSILFTLMYLRSYKMNRDAKKYYLGIVFFIAVTLISHLQVGALTSLAALFLLLFCVEGWSKKILQIFKVFVPTAALSAFFFLPFLASTPKQFVGEIHLGNAPVPMSGIVFMYPGDFNTVSPLIVPISVLALLVLRHRKLSFDDFSLGVLKAFGVLFALLFVYAFTRLPPQVYVFSPYDVPFYLTLLLSVCAGVILGRIFKGYKSVDKRRNITAILLVIVLIAAVAQLPILHSFVNDTGVESWFSGYYVTQNLIKINASDFDHRFGSDWDGISTWFNYWYDIPQTRGFYDLGRVYPNWYNWLEDAVWRQKANYKETMFLLNWYAVKSFAVAWPHYNYEKFLSDTQAYEVVSKLDTPTLCTMYQFDYKFALPIISATNATTLLVVGEPRLYEDLFHSLAYGNFNERYVIPIRSQNFVDDYSLEQLQEFDVLYVSLYTNYYRDLEKAWRLLREYVSSGGGLLIDTGSSELSFIPLPSPVNSTSRVSVPRKNWNFSIIEHETTNSTNFNLFSSPGAMSYSSPKKIHSWAKAVLWSQNDALVVLGEYQNGRVLWSGLNLPQRISDNKNFMEAFFLFRMIDWVSKGSGRISNLLVSQCESNTDWSVSWVTSGARGNLTLDGSVKKTGSYSLKLGYSFADPVHRDEVNYVFNPSGRWNWSDADFFSVWIFGDGSNNEATFYLEKTDSRDSFWFKLRLDWEGWRQVVYWFDQMGKYGFADSSSVDKIEITINDYPYVNATSGYINIDGIYVGKHRASSEISKTTNERPNPEKVVIHVNNPAKGILFKEVYFNRWNAYLSDQAVNSLKIYRAGPDFMYVRIPNDVNYPLKVVFEYRRTVIEQFGYALSVSSLFILVLYGIGAPLVRLVVNTFQKFSCRYHGRRDQMRSSIGKSQRVK